MSDDSKTTSSYDLEAAVDDNASGPIRTKVAPVCPLLRWREENSVGATEQWRRPAKLLHSPSCTRIHVEPKCFQRIDKSWLAKLVKEKMSDQLQAFGGVEGVFSVLQTHVENGIAADAPDISSRIQSFGFNKIQTPSPKMLRIAFATLKDPIFVLLLVTASLSMGFSIKRHGGLSGVYDALFIFGSLFLVMAAICVSKIWAATQFQALSNSNNSVSTLVIRDGRKQNISRNDVVVGDLVCLQIRDQVPADGLLLQKEISFQVNESCLTSAPNSLKLPFLLSGSKVTKGYARMLVTAVGMDTKWGEMMSSKCPADIKTPLQVRLHKLTWYTAKVGLAVASMVLIALLIQYFTGNMKDDSGAVLYTSSKSICHVFQDIIRIFVWPIVIASTTIPEGLRLAVTITLAYSAKRMAAENVSVRNIAAFEGTGSVTAICVDRSSTISPKVEQFLLGGMKSSMKHNRQQRDAEFLQIIHEGIGLNTISGSCSVLDELQAEKAIHDWAVQEVGMNLAQLKEKHGVLDAYSNPQKKQGLVYIKRNGDNRVHVHMNGSTDMILTQCSHYYEDNGEVKVICTNTGKYFKKFAEEMKNNGLNCIAYAHAAISGHLDENNDYPRPMDLTLIGFLGLKDLFRPNISNALGECQQAGVKVIMITTEDCLKAKESAMMCGIFKPHHIIASDDIIEGMKFRKIANDQERLKKVEKIGVIAEACNSDKLLLVQCLKQKGHGVAVIGGFPGDEEVFEKADVNFFPEIQESRFMMEKSDIVIKDGSFTTIASAMRRVRGMHNNIQIIAQFQLTVTITSLITDSMSTIFGGEPPNINIVAFAALQILWVKLVVGTLVVLALSIDDPAESLVKVMPVKQRGPFVTNIMWRDIIGQSLWQIMILLTVQFRGESAFKLTATEKAALIFNIPVLYQIFNILNKVKGKNISEILTKKRLFWMVIGIIIRLQVVIVELLGRFAGTARLNWKQWRGCIGIATTSWLIGWILGKIPVPEEPFFCSL